MKALRLTHRLYIALIALAMLTVGCDGEGLLPCENGDGVRVTEPRTQNDFNKIILDLPGDLYITRGNDFSVEITAQQNVIDEISTNVRGNILEIKNERCLRSYKTIRVDVTMPTISGLEVDGSGDIYVLDRFETGNLDLYVRGSGSIDIASNAAKAYIEVNGSGDISLDTEAGEMETKVRGAGDVFLSGNVNMHDVDMEGSGNVEAFDLLSDVCDIRIAGSGDARVNVASALTVKIRGSGDVQYKGTPTVDADISGSGQLESVN